ncbi:hypothetical protein [Bifidobacterium vansinderenii]|uniref:Uncharacterized protein n=1 Tax=Bifidobacterium vansinderenii TaxID=1984871 RepID=A0A229W1C8_9BIFI|nr:hypothetical protein [Bifidobacterium vansinderenii]OXN01667.1 hypothetical protein Tam10B_0109 [Bifidobacterium vansinderenii]
MGPLPQLFNSTEFWTAVIVSGLGSGGLIAWILRRIDKHLDRHEKVLTRDELDLALAESPVIRSFETKLDRDWERFEEADRDRRAIRLDVLRIEMFAHTNTRTQHERQLEAGKEYLALGGNGLGHARYDALKADYVRREQACDWTYR